MARQILVEQITHWISRTIAALLLLVLPGLLGMAADRRLETTFLMPLGFAFGMAIFMLALLLMVKNLAPVARGKPLGDPEDDARYKDDDQQLGEDVDGHSDSGAIDRKDR